MTFSEELKAALAPKHLLNHPFYQAWSAGQLSNTTLQDYAAQYYQHVKAFPRYISATHSICEEIEDRKLLLENLVDEENNGVDHPELWMRFAESVGCNRDDVKAAKPLSVTQTLIDTFFTGARASYAEGLCSLYTYEHQVPEIAQTKIDGLKEFYGVTDERGLSFFETHKGADVWHREQCEKLIDALPVASQAAAKQAALNTADALWNFLTSVGERADAREGNMQGSCGTACGCA